MADEASGVEWMRECLALAKRDDSRGIMCDTSAIEATINALDAANARAAAAEAEIERLRENLAGLFEHLDDSGEKTCPVVAEYRDALLAESGHGEGEGR